MEYIPTLQEAVEMADYILENDEAYNGMVREWRDAAIRGKLNYYMMEGLVEKYEQVKNGE